MKRDGDRLTLTCEANFDFAYDGENTLSVVGKLYAKAATHLFQGFLSFTMQPLVLL